MVNKVTRPKVDSALPSDLVDWALRGRIRVPSFQRSYRWDRHDVTKLFDSIYRGYPIGNLLAWQRPAPAGNITLGHLRLDVPEVPDAFWIVDGQQRIISIVGALTANPQTVDPRFRIYFDLQENSFVSVPRNQSPPDHLMPMYVTLDTARANSWIRSRPQFTDAQIAVADQVIAAIRDYRIPMYIVTGEDEYALRDIFDRMNTYGQSLKSAEVFNALNAVPGDQEPSDLHTLASGVATFGFGEFSERILMQSLLAIRGPRVDRDFRDEFKNNRDRLDAFLRTELVIEKVIEFLRDIADIPHVRLLPYSLYIPLLARFIALFDMPQDWAGELLRRWIWRGAVVGVAPQGNTIAIRRGASAVHGDPISSANRLLSLLAPNSKPWKPDLSQIALNRAQARLNILGMLSREPRLLPSHSDHAPVRIDFAKLLDVGQILVPITPMNNGLGRGIANRIIYPSVPGRDFLRLLASADIATFSSHCIDPESIDLLLAGNFNKFLERRAEVLSEIITDYVQQHALFGFRDGPDVPSLFEDTPDDEEV
jgi:hypothetical protein